MYIVLNRNGIDNMQGKNILPKTVRKLKLENSWSVQLEMQLR